MEIQKVILYYAFTPLSDSYAILVWQRNLCESLGLKGRILISPQGINGTVGGDMSAVKKYIKATKKYPGFKRIVFKWSDGNGTDFPRLSVKLKDELVAFGNPGEIKVNEKGVVGGGIHLRPEEVNKLVEERGDEVVFFDGRNAFEAKIGKFKNAIVPDVVTSADFVAEIESGKYDHLKTKPVVTYCTGGIRCEILSAVMKNRGFQEVYQIDGGIVKYGERFGDKGLWEGSLYIFDNRMAMDFSESAKVIGKCENCASSANRFSNCPKIECHELVLLCPSCVQANVTQPCNHEYDRRRKHGSDGIRRRDRELIG